MAELPSRTASAQDNRIYVSPPFRETIKKAFSVHKRRKPFLFYYCSKKNS